MACWKRETVLPSILELPIMLVTTRCEKLHDLEAIRRANREAFGQVDEARLVDQLRTSGDLRLSLVAEYDGQVVGHLLLSAAKIVSPGRTLDVLVLAPVAVAPTHQRQGVGSTLISEALGICRDAGHQVVLVVGHLDYYPRFGFSADLAVPLRCEYSGPHFMALELRPGALDGVEGEVRFASPFSRLSATNDDLRPAP